ncbi:MAG: YbhB/YbcL family Raf kinase inhibitor-like protein [Anaerolineales bacterium]|nr:YbhB/YbcL family Raf kinase inhibitor-like protein [Anaerolineales bacterium]
MLRKFLSIFFLLSLLTGCMVPPTEIAVVVPATNETAVITSPISQLTNTGFTLTSTDVTDGGRLPVEYTCDGDGSTLPLTWSGAPAETQSYAVIMHHEAPDGIHWYWVLYNISANVTNLSKNVSGIGTLGNNINNGLAEYSPPCSKGPGDKTYTYTVYALSAEPQINVPAEQVNRDTLLAAMEGFTLASAEMNVVYAREGMTDPNTQGNQQGQGNNNQGNNKQPADGAPAYNIEQAVSDKAQGMTISYDALAFMTGDLGSDSFFPPGKVADFWGFQYLRDNDPSHMGHAGDFLTSAAMNTPITSHPTNAPNWLHLLKAKWTTSTSTDTSASCSWTHSVASPKVTSLLEQLVSTKKRSNPTRQSCISSTGRSVMSAPN